MVFHPFKNWVGVEWYSINPLFKLTLSLHTKQRVLLFRWVNFATRQNICFTRTSLHHSKNTANILLNLLYFFGPSEKWANFASTIWQLPKNDRSSMNYSCWKFFRGEKTVAIVYESLIIFPNQSPDVFLWWDQYLLSMSLIQRL
jgi:hypothetical protein